MAAGAYRQDVCILDISTLRTSEDAEKGEDECSEGKEKGKDSR